MLIFLHCTEERLIIMIKTYPKDILEKVEFDKVLEYLSKELLGERAKEAITTQQFLITKKEIDQKLDEVDQYSKAVEDGNDLPIHAYDSVQGDIPLLRKEGYVLSVEAIRRIYMHIQQAKHLNEYFDKDENKSDYPLLFKIFSIIDIDPELLKEIDRVLDDQGEVRPDASPELLKIHRAIRNRERELDMVFSSAIKKYGGHGYLSDTVESMRNGRRVLTIGAEHKRKVDGVIHDESATGKNVYIEPAEVMQINNAIFNLYTEKKKEIYKVLKDLCSQIRPYASQILDIEEVLIELDVIRGKSRLASKMDAKRPEVVDEPHFGFKEAYNPVLYLKNIGINKDTIPFDLELHGSNRLLVLSGPNAGGKSVTMKSVGVLQFMVQFGMLIPADENSKIGIFKKIFSDIGDQQSLEDDLSTYSSRLQNMKFFIDHVDEDSLVLIDEFGSGTDPKIGGAIAEAILKQINYQQAYGVITTHYSNLKYFAFKTKGVVNGGMEFNKKKLAPTYQLIVGKPGSSFAFEIAQKSGLPKKVLDYARHKTGKNEKAIDELLTNLQAEKKELEDRMASLLDKEDKVDKMVRTYNELHKELEYRRKKLKLQRKEIKLQEANFENKELEKTIREIKEAKNLEKAKEIAKQHRSKRQEVQNEISDLQNDVYYGDGAALNKELVVGDFVKMRLGGSSGKLVGIDKGMATVEMGFLTMEVPLSELLPANAPIEYKSRSVDTSGVATSSNFENKLDIRGYKISDAKLYVQEFLEKAIINNAQQLKIIHGKGSGALRKTVMQKLKEYKDVKEIWHPEDEMGGDGITFVEL